jgi:hypothetical protein
MLTDRFDCYAFVFELLSLAFGIDSAVAKNRGLSLVTATLNPKFLGFQVPEFSYCGPAVKRINLPRPCSYTVHHPGTQGNEWPQLCDVTYIHATGSEKRCKIRIMWLPAKLSMHQGPLTEGERGEYGNASNFYFRGLLIENV